MTFFFYYLGYDSHDGPDVTAKRVKDEEELLRYLLKQKGQEPKETKKLNKDSIRATLERNFKEPEVKEILAAVALPSVETNQDLLRAVSNTKKIQVLMALIMLDEDNEH